MEHSISIPYLAEKPQIRILILAPSIPLLVLRTHDITNGADW